MTQSQNVKKSKYKNVKKQINVKMYNSIKYNTK